VQDAKTVSPEKAMTDQSQIVYNTAGITEKPEYPGGMGEFYKFIGDNYVTPKDNQLKGKIYVIFVVETDGSLSNIRFFRDIGFGTGEEAVRVLNLCPNWIPGKLDGKPVRVEYSLPISIQAS
jgi:hypothetical protein